MNLRLAPSPLSVAAALVGLGLFAPAPARAGWHFTSFDGPVVKDTEVYGVTNDGTVTGFTYDASGQAHGFIWRDGKMKTVDYPGQGPLGLLFYQANQHGMVSGGYYDAAGISHALIYDLKTQKFKVLPNVPGATLNLAGGINDVGVLAGNITDDPAQSIDLVAWLYADGQYHFSVDPASDQAIYGTITQELNDNNDLVGYYYDAKNVAHGFLKPLHGQYIPLDVNGADNTEAYGINNQGAITGRYMKNETRHGFILFHGNVTTVDYPGATQTWITAINDNGVIGGFYEDARGIYHGFVAHHTP